MIGKKGFGELLQRLAQIGVEVDSNCRFEAGFILGMTGVFASPQSFATIIQFDEKGWTVRCTSQPIDSVIIEANLITLIVDLKLKHKDLGIGWSCTKSTTPLKGLEVVQCEISGQMTDSALADIQKAVSKTHRAMTQIIDRIAAMNA